MPQHITLELTTRRSSSGLFAKSRGCPVIRADFTIEVAERLFKQLESAGDIALTLDGAGDPLLHPRFDEIIRAAKNHGIAGIQVRTELLADRATIDRLLSAEVDVISIDLHADRAATYQAMMGCDRFKEVLLNIDYVLEHRRQLTSQPGTAALALPWVVPHLQRRIETYEDIDSFFDRWQAMLGTAVIEEPGDGSHSGLTPATTPQRVVQRDLARTMTILSDGSLPMDPNDFTGSNTLGNAQSATIESLWAQLLSQRFARPDA